MAVMVSLTSLVLCGCGPVQGDNHSEERPDAATAERFCAAQRDLRDGTLSFEGSVEEAFRKASEHLAASAPPELGDAMQQLVRSANNEPVDPVVLRDAERELRVWNEQNCGSSDLSGV